VRDLGPCCGTMSGFHKFCKRLSCGCRPRSAPCGTASPRAGAPRTPPRRPAQQRCASAPGVAAGAPGARQGRVTGGAARGEQPTSREAATVQGLSSASASPRRRPARPPCAAQAQQGGTDAALQAPHVRLLSASLAEHTAVQRTGHRGRKQRRQSSGWDRRVRVGCDGASSRRGALGRCAHLKRCCRGARRCIVPLLFWQAPRRARRSVRAVSRRIRRALPRAPHRTPLALSGGALAPC